HALHRRTVVGLPLVRPALRELALAEEMVEAGDRRSLLQAGRVFGEINLRRLLQSGVNERQPRRVRRSCDGFVGTIQIGETRKLCRGIVLSIKLYVNSEARSGKQSAIAGERVLANVAAKIFRPALQRLALNVERIDFTLDILVGPFNRARPYQKEDT